MVQKLRKRYLIANMTLLSCTLLIALTVLFVMLYRTEVQSSYDVMNELLADSEIAETPQTVLAPMSQTADSGSDTYLNLYMTTDATTTANAFSTGLTVTTTATANQNDADLYCQHREYRYDFPPYWDFDDDANDGSDDWWGYQPPPPPPPESDNDSNEHDNPTTTTFITVSTTVTTITTTQRSKEPVDHTMSSSAPHDEPPQHSETITFTTSSGFTETSAATTTVATTASTKALITMNGDGKYIPDALIAQIAPDGQISSYAGSSNDATPDGDLHTVNSAVSEIREKGDQTGTIDVGDTSYRYIYQPHADGSYQMVLLNRTLELSVLSKMLMLFVILAVFGLICMFGISVLLANWTVRPVALAWEKQKQFVADASHELKTPLAVISANTEVILANPQDAVVTQSKWLNYIKSETMRMSKLITNLLTVARMDHNQETEHLAALNFYELVSNVCLVFEPIIYENGKTLNTVLQRNVMLRGDEDSLKQLLSILLDNAVLHSTPAAEITVTLSRDAQGKIRLAVANTAKDIPQEQLHHLFDRFYRLNPEGSPNGSGLGLSIAKSIVQDMGGMLTVHSENRVVTFVATFSSS